MLGYVVWRLVTLVPVLFSVLLITFVLMHQVPGGPWDRQKQLPEAALANLNRKYHLDEPLPAQFGRYLLNALRGDLGVSFRGDRPVTSIIREGFAVSATLGLLSLTVAITTGVSLGTVAALNRNRPIDYLATMLATIGASTPSFILGTVLVVLFAIRLQWLPTSDWGTARQTIMPVIALATLPTAFLARITRASMLDVLDQEYIRAARAKGLADVTILVRHILRNALIPVLTLLGPLAATLVTGSFIVEQFFAIPGIGRQFVTAVFARDYGVILGTTVFYAFLVAVANLLVDILYGVADPRVRYR